MRNICKNSEKVDCSLCTAKMLSRRSIGRHLFHQHPGVALKDYYLGNLMRESDYYFRFCVRCRKERPFGTSVSGFTSNLKSTYCNDCRIKYDKGTHSKISQKVKSNWAIGLYKNTATKNKERALRRTPEETARLVRPMLESQKNFRFHAGYSKGLWYRSSYEKAFIEAVSTSTRYSIIKQNHGITYWFNTKRSLYLVDFVLYDSKRETYIFVEVKGNTPFYQKELQSGLALAKYGTANRLCRDYGLEFRFIGKVTPRTLEYFLN